MDFCFHQQRLDHSLSGLGPAQLVGRFSALWESLTPAEKSNFKRGVVGGVHRGLGSSQAGVAVRPQSAAERERAEQWRLKMMRKEVKDLVRRGRQDQDLETKIFYVVSTNYFCITNEKQIVPAELGLAKFSLRGGVLATYHVLVQPGTLPRGYRADCVAHSKATHNIPLDYSSLCGDYTKIMEDILIFMMEDEDKEDSSLPPLYCDPENFEQNKIFLNWIIEKSNTDLKEDIGFELFSLPFLLYEMTRSEESSAEVSSSSMSEVKVEPSLTIAAVLLGRDTFMFLTESCEWHQECEAGRYYCSLSSVLSFCYIFLSQVCPHYSIHLLEGSHMPQGYSRPNLTVESSVSSASSNLSRDISDTEETLSQVSQSSSNSRPGPRVSERNNNIFEYLRGKGRGVSHQGRVVPVGRNNRIDYDSSLELSTDRSQV